MQIACSLCVQDWDRLPMTKNNALKDIRKSVENSFSIVKQNVEALGEKDEFSFIVLNIRLGKASGGHLIMLFKQIKQKSQPSKRKNE